MQSNQDTLRASFCHALSEMYKGEVPLYGSLVDLVYQADTEALHQQLHSNQTHHHRHPLNLDPDTILPPRHRVERHGAIRLGTASELRTIRRMFALMGMHPVSYYDLSLAGFPMHATAFRPTDRAALSAHPFRVFTTVLRLDLLTPRTRELACAALEKRQLFSNNLLELISLAEANGGFFPSAHSGGGEGEDLAQSFIKEALGSFRWHSRSSVSREQYALLQAEHPLIADIVSFPSCHINHLTPRTVDIDAVQRLMRAHGLPAKERIEGPPRRSCPILLRQTSFKALEETVYFREGGGEEGKFVRGSHTARFGEVEQRGQALTRKGRDLYDLCLGEVEREVSEMGDAGADAYEGVLERAFKERFPDDIETLRTQRLAYFVYRVTESGDRARARVGEMQERSVEELLKHGVLECEPVVYEDFLPLSAGGIFNSNLGGGGVSEAKRLVLGARADREGFHDMMGAETIDEFGLYESMQRDSLKECARELGVKELK